LVLLVAVDELERARVGGMNTGLEVLDVHRLAWKSCYAANLATAGAAGKADHLEASPQKLAGAFRVGSPRSLLVDASRAKVAFDDPVGGGAAEAVLGRLLAVVATVPSHQMGPSSY